MESNWAANALSRAASTKPSRSVPASRTLVLNCGGPCGQEEQLTDVSAEQLPVVFR